MRTIIIMNKVELRQNYTRDDISKMALLDILRSCKKAVEQFKQSNTPISKRFVYEAVMMDFHDSFDINLNLYYERWLFQNFGLDQGIQFMKDKFGPDFSNVTCKGIATELVSFYAKHIIVNVLRYCNGLTDTSYDEIIWKIENFPLRTMVGEIFDEDF